MLRDAWESCGRPFILSLCTHGNHTALVFSFDGLVACVFLVLFIFFLIIFLLRDLLDVATCLREPDDLSRSPATYEIAYFAL